MTRFNPISRDSTHTSNPNSLLKLATKDAEHHNKMELVPTSAGKLAVAIHAAAPPRAVVCLDPYHKDENSNVKDEMQSGRRSCCEDPYPKIIKTTIYAIIVVLIIFRLQKNNNSYHQFIDINKPWFPSTFSLRLQSWLLQLMHLRHLRLVLV